MENCRDEGIFKFGGRAEGVQPAANCGSIVVSAATTTLNCVCALKAHGVCLEHYCHCSRNASKRKQINSKGSGSFHNHAPPPLSLFHVHNQGPLPIAPINEYPAAPGNERSS